ncbi:hypothetical protein KEM56_007167 [Ascosphaera pollenicola]|nr:hypothetical protein KEM56_007167 [Ascosphaera pollenicola]
MEPALEVRLVKHTKRGIDPPIKLACNAKEYTQWAFFIQLKFEDDAPLFPDDGSKIHYALQQMNPPLWDNMRVWLTNFPGTPNWHDFISKIKSFLDIKFLKTDARSQIDKMFQGTGKSVSDLFARMSVQWLLADFTVSEKLCAFRRALRPGIQSALLNVKDAVMTNERMFLEEARNAEHNLDLKQEANNVSGRNENTPR